MEKRQSRLAIGAIYALATAGLLASQSPLSFLAAKRLSVPVFISVTELVLLFCVPFMIRSQRAREHFRTSISSLSNVGKYAVLLLIGLIGILLYAMGLGKGHPIVIAAVLNLDPFWAAIIAYLIAGKTIPTSLSLFTLCLLLAFSGAMLLAISQTDSHSISMRMFDSNSLFAAGLALPVPILWALSGSLVGKWFSNYDEYACVAVTFVMAAVVVVPVALAVAYAQSGLKIAEDALPAVALLTVGTILATALGRVLYQKSLTITDNNNGFVSIFFLLIPAFTCLLSLGYLRGSMSSNSLLDLLLHRLAVDCRANLSSLVALAARGEIASGIFEALCAVGNASATNILATDRMLLGGRRWSTCRAYLEVARKPA